MKKLDNRGFAITTIVYSLLLLTAFTIFLMLKNTSKQRDLDEEFIKNVETQLNQSVISGT
jgi:c-di-AMP phosphodiesterase-like protein